VGNFCPDLIEIPFLKTSFFEPWLAATHWLVNDNPPASFKTVEQDWKNYFLVSLGCIWN
jgi:hypothetical protein